MEPENWDKLYLQLYAFADQLLKAHTWFRGKKTDSYLEGRQPHDYVQDAIEKYLKEPDKYDPTKRTLAGYLKLHIIRTAVGNDSKKSENKLSSDIFAGQNANAGQEDDLLDALLPYSEALFDQEIDFEMIMNDIELAIQDDPVALQIFEGTCRDKLNRRDVMEKCNMSDTSYDNGMKRLKTVIRSAIKKYNITEPKRVKKKKPDTENI